MLNSPKNHLRRQASIFLREVCVDRDYLKPENKVEIKKEGNKMVLHWPPPCMASVSSLYRCSGLQNPCWQHKSLYSHNTKVHNAKRYFMYGHSKLKNDLCNRPYLVAVFFEKVSGSFQRRKSSLMRKFTLQKKRELFKYKDFILAVRSHNRVRSLDLSMAELNDIIFLPPKNSLCRLCTVPVS